MQQSPFGALSLGESLPKQEDVIAPQVDEQPQAVPLIDEEKSTSGDIGEIEGEGEERERKRQRRLLQNRQSAARSRHRKKEMLQTLERKSTDLDSENNVIKQQLYNYEQRIRALEQRIAITAKQNDELINLLKNSNKVDELQRILNIYSAIVLPSDLSKPSDQALLQAVHLQQQLGMSSMNAIKMANSVIAAKSNEQSMTLKSPTRMEES